MKKKTIKGKDNKELRDMLDDKSKALSKFKADIFSGKAKNLKDGKEIRKDIARILTELNTKLDTEIKTK